MLEGSNILYSYLWHTPYDSARPSAAYFRDKVFHSDAMKKGKELSPSLFHGIILP
jgi:hypothetical protein